MCYGIVFFLLLKAHSCYLSPTVFDHSWEKSNKEKVRPFQLSQEQCHRHREHPGGARKKVRSSVTQGCQELESEKRSICNLLGHVITQNTAVRHDVCESETCSCTLTSNSVEKSGTLHRFAISQTRISSAVNKII